MGLKLPGITVNYIDSIKNFVPNSQKGVICMLANSSHDRVTEVPGGTVPVELDEEEVEFALAAGARKVIIVESTSPASFPKVCARYDFDVIFASSGADSADAIAVATAKNADGQPCIAVVDKAATSANNEYVIRLATEDIKLADETVGSEKYVSRIAGLVAGMGVKGSLTKMILPDVLEVPYQSKAEIEAEIAKGNLVLMNDKGIVKIARGVNTKLPQNTSNSKIRTIVCKNELTKLLKEVLDSHIGQTPNSYNNKLLILGAVASVLTKLAEEQVIEPDFTVDLDVEAIANYLGQAAADLTYDELRRANTGDQLFIIVKVKLLDVIEEITIKVQA